MEEYSRRVSAKDRVVSGAIYTRQFPLITENYCSIDAGRGNSGRKRQSTAVYQQHRGHWATATANSGSKAVHLGLIYLCVHGDLLENQRIVKLRVERSGKVAILFVVGSMRREVDSQVQALGKGDGNGWGSGQTRHKKELKGQNNCVPNNVLAMEQWGWDAYSGSCEKLFKGGRRFVDNLKVPDNKSWRRNQWRR
jgi:hypothetical protein